MSSSYSGWILDGAPCWVWQQSMYVPGIIASVESKATKARVQLIGDHSHTLIDSPFTQILERQAPATTGAESEPDTADMVHMTYLNEGEILDNLRRRYHRNEIFTYIGPTLIVMNPYKEVAPIDQSLIERIKDELGIAGSARDSTMSTSSSAGILSTVTPHTYAISGVAYKQMFRNSRNQAIVISGESGAGKTENAKSSMQFLTSLSQSDGQQSMIQSLRCKSTSKLLEEFNQFAIEVKILACNPILEAFGNAKTVRNNNSSRFGKYVKIYIDRISHKIQGASIENYLLEKSRITTPAKGERNYHIFYHLLKGSTEVAHLLQNKNAQASDFTYLSRSGCFAVDTVPDAKLYLEVKRSLKQMNFSQTDQEGILVILAAILFLGNAQLKGSSSSSSSGESGASFLLSKDFMSACELLQVNPKQLNDALVLKVRKVGVQVISSPMQESECNSMRDSLSKNLYDNLFNFLVRKLNDSLLPPADLRSSCLSIGLLDIFGFESFDVNSFEQLCINFTNEKLQQLYVQYIFKSEEVDYMQQGITGVFAELHYQENQLIIDVIEKKPLGILILLDESCQLASSTDDAFLNAINKNHSKNTTLVSFPKKDKNTFCLSHTAKEVVYNISGFREKNKDEVSLELETCLTSSGNSMIASLFGQGEKSSLGDASSQKHPQSAFFKQPNGNNLGTSSSSAAKKPTRFLGQKFRQSLNDLMTELTSSDVHFIRCIKPNEQKQPNTFDYQFIFQQVQYQGLLDSIKIRRFGYAHRMTYEAFFLEFQELGESTKSLTLAKIATMKLDLPTLIRNNIFNAPKLLEVAKLPATCVAFGNTKIFMKTELIKYLHLRITAVVASRKAAARRIVLSFRKFLFRKHIKANLAAMKAKIVAMQSIARMFICKRRYSKKRKALKILASFATHKVLARAIAALKSNAIAKVATSFCGLLLRKSHLQHAFQTLKRVPQTKKPLQQKQQQTQQQVPQQITPPKIQLKETDNKQVAAQINLPSVQNGNQMNNHIHSKLNSLNNSNKASAFPQDAFMNDPQLVNSGCLEILQEMNEDPRRRDIPLVAGAAAGVVRSSIRVVPSINFTAGTGRPMSKAWRSTLLRASRYPGGGSNTIGGNNKKDVASQKKRIPLIVKFTEMNPVSVFGEYHECETIDLDEIDESDDSVLNLDETALNEISKQPYASLLPTILVKQTKWGVKQPPEKIMKYSSKPISSALTAIADLPRIATYEDTRDALDLIRSIAQQNAMSQLTASSILFSAVPEKYEETISLLSSSAVTSSGKSGASNKARVLNPKKAVVGRDVQQLDRCNSIAVQTMRKQSKVKQAIFPLPIAVKVSTMKKSPSDKAVSTFKCMMKCAGERKSRFNRHTNLAKLLAICSEGAGEMREEAYLHLCKQLACNASKDSRLKYLKIFGILSSFLPTTVRFFYPLLQFLHARLSSESIDADERKWFTFCLMRMMNSEQIQRGCLPSDTEIIMIENMKKVMLRVYLMNGVPITIGVESYTSVAALKRMMLNELGIDARRSSYGLMEVRWNKAKRVQESRFIDENERIMDVIAFWDSEQVAANLAQPSKTLKGGSTTTTSTTAQPTDFYLQNYKELTGLQVQLGIRVFFPLEESDTKAISAFYTQLYAEVHRNKYVILEEHDFLNLAALQLLVDYPRKLIVNAIKELLELIGDEPSLFIPEEPSPVTRKITPQQSRSASRNKSKNEMEEQAEEDEEDRSDAEDRDNGGENDSDGDVESTRAYRAFVEERQSEEILMFDPSFYIPSTIYYRREPSEWRDVILSTLHKNKLFRGKRQYTPHQAKLAYIIYLSKQDLFMSTTFRDVKYSRVKLASLNDTISSLEKYEQMVVDSQKQNAAIEDEIMLAINPSNILICDQEGMQRPKRRIQIKHVLKFCCTQKQVIVISKDQIKHIFETPAHCNEITYLIRAYLKIYIEKAQQEEEEKKKEKKKNVDNNQS